MKILAREATLPVYCVYGNLHETHGDRHVTVSNIPLMFYQFWGFYNLSFAPSFSKQWLNCVSIPIPILILARSFAHFLGCLPRCLNIHIVVFLGSNWNRLVIFFAIATSSVVFLHFCFDTHSDCDVLLYWFLFLSIRMSLSVIYSIPFLPFRFIQFAIFFVGPHSLFSFIVSFWFGYRKRCCGSWESIQCIQNSILKEVHTKIEWYKNPFEYAIIVYFWKWQTNKQIIWIEIDVWWVSYKRQCKQWKSV